MKILIAESEGFSPAALQLLRPAAVVETADLDRAELLSAVGDADVLWVRLRHSIDEQVFDAAKRLRVVLTNTTGVNHIDLDSARRHHVHVMSLRGETVLLRTVRGTAELTLALALALVRRLPAATNHVRDGGWDRYGFKGHDLYEKTAGIVGFGRLGQIVAGYFRALGMRVLVATRDADPSLALDGSELIGLDELLAAADLVSVHVDLNSATGGMFGARQFAAMKRGAWFVNTSRGEVVDEAALLAVLQSGQLRGAALDVLSDELQVAPGSRPLVRYAATHDNLIVTPHIGGYTFESLARTELHLAEKLLVFLAQERTPGPATTSL